MIQKVHAQIFFAYPSIRVSQRAFLVPIYSNSIRDSGETGAY